MLVLGASLSASVSVYVSVSGSVSDSAELDEAEYIRGGARRRRDIADAPAGVVRVRRDVTSGWGAVVVRWQASGLGSAPTDVPTASGSSAGALGLTESCIGDDDSASGRALTGTKVILNLRAGRGGAVGWGGGADIGGGS